jgi:hypothetical protein
LVIDEPTAALAPMPAIVTALLTAGVTAATTTLTERAVNSLLETKWDGTPEEKGMIEDKVVMQCAVLGSNDKMKRTSYAASPILKHIKKNRATRGC